jgi:hypothetical protein
MDRRLTPSSRRSFGQEMARSPGTSTNRKSSSPRRTTSVLTDRYQITVADAVAITSIYGPAS